MYISVAGGSQDATYSSIELENFGKKGEYSKYRKYIEISLVLFLSVFSINSATISFRNVNFLLIE